MEFIASSGNTATATNKLDGKSGHSVSVGWRQNPSDGDMREFRSWYEKNQAPANAIIRTRQGLADDTVQPDNQR